jgi:rhomboid protease GluP
VKEPERRQPPPAPPEDRPTRPPRGPSGIQNLFQRFPTTFGLIAITVAVFLQQWITAALFGDGLVCGRGDLLCALGVKQNQAIRAGEIWRFVSPIFIHVNLLHLFVNMYSLYALGPATERFFGAPRTLAFYVLTGIMGVVFSLLFSPQPSAGASGAIFGLLGAFGAFLFLHRDIFGRLGKLQLRQIVIVALINLTLGLSPGIDNWGHFGGLLTGIGLTWLMGPRFELKQFDLLSRQVVDRQPWNRVRTRMIVAAALVAAAALLIASPPIGG